MKRSSVTIVGGETIPLWSWRGVQYWPAVGVYLILATIVLGIAGLLSLVGRRES